MSNSILLEKLTSNHLILLVLGNIFVLVMFFVAGGKGPRPTNAMIRITKSCYDNIQKFERNNQPIDGETCNQHIELTEENPTFVGNNVVFYVVLPTDKMPDMTMSRWFQWMICVLDVKVLQDRRITLRDEKPLLTFKGAIFGRNNPGDTWELVHHLNPTELHTRRLNCWTDEESDIIECGDVPLFELGSVFYKQYLINIQLPERNNLNKKVPRLAGIDIIEIHQNGGFTKVYVGQKSVICPILLIATVLYIRQVKLCDSSPLLITRVIGALGIINIIYNVPLEYISLLANVPELRVWYDISSGIFYAAMAVLWLLFVGEHRMDLDQRNKFSNYWKEILAISVCCIVMFLFDIIERGMQVVDPFHSIWSSSGGERAAHVLLVVSASCASFYLVVLLYLMVRAVLSMSRKRASLANVGRVRQMYYEGLIFRFKTMVYTTVLCGLVTGVLFILVNFNEMYYKWGKPAGQIEISSAFLVGVTGLWNLYVLNILFLYAPVSNTLASGAAEYETLEMTEVNVNEKLKAQPQDALKTLTKPSAD